ncbi:flippase [Lactobacillus helveticus]|uniref:flippase n=1 Tax=Lactobacillus helveticus TaxID=1587 RepID=UPI0021C395E3|nr:flippase [Lactobacillus helveticus]MCP9317510.1 flippase [Lactobacillus helveticus]MDH5818199.1 flippase [Lactobacillus helveticus]
MKKKSLGINAFLNSLRSILNILFPIITFPYVSRVLQVKGIGIYNFSNSIVSYFSLIAALGISTYAVREGAKIRDNIHEISQFASEIFTINIFSTLISYILLFLCLFAFSKLHNYAACILIFSLQIFFTTIGTEWIYQIYEDYGYITLRSIIFQILSLVLLFIFVRGPQDYLKYAVITIFSAVGANIFNFIHARQFCRIRVVWHFNWRVHLTPILIIFGANIANMIYVNSDITLLGLMKSNYIVGLYSVSSKIYQIVKTLIAALLMVTIPRLAMLFGKNRLKEYKSILFSLTNTLVLIALPASVGLVMLSKEIVLLISGKEYLRATNSLAILSLAYIFSILAWILTDCVLIPSKREKYVLRSMGSSAILNVLLNIILIPPMNEDAAALSTVLAEMCMFIVNYHYAKDLVSDIFTSRKFFKNLMDSFVGCIGIVIVCLLCRWGWDSTIMMTISSIVLSIAMYGAILVLMKNAIIFSWLKKVKDIVSKNI